jgi:hypothetical protein
MWANKQNLRAARAMSRSRIPNRSKLTRAYFFGHFLRIALKTQHKATNPLKVGASIPFRMREIRFWPFMSEGLNNLYADLSHL